MFCLVIGNKPSGACYCNNKNSCVLKVYLFFKNLIYYIYEKFDWRHKILDALQNMQSDITLKGIVESDETFFALSFKGTKEENFSIPRVAHNRGHSVSTLGLSSEMVCVVPCMANHEGLSVEQVSNQGKPKVTDLEKVINNRIDLGSVFVTDSLRGYQKVAVSNELVHVRIT